jgi:hypothetical protein
LIEEFAREPLVFVDLVDDWIDLFAGKVTGSRLNGFLLGGQRKIGTSYLHSYQSYRAESDAIAGRR